MKNKFSKIQIPGGLPGGGGGGCWSFDFSVTLTDESYSIIVASREEERERINVIRAASRKKCSGRVFKNNLKP